MSLCKNGQIANCCQLNAIMTLKEYLEDYASEDTKKAGEALIAKEVKKIPKDKHNRHYQRLSNLQTSSKI